MPSGSRWYRRVARSNAGLSRPSTPHFVKLVLSSSIRRGKMQIPQQFARKYSHNFADAVELRVPNGDLWPVKLEHSEGKLWLGEGWRKFQDRYRLKEGSLLLFHLEGNAVFQVLVFDRSCSEIDYPVKITPGVRTQPSNDLISSESEDDNNDSLDIDYCPIADYMPSGSRRMRRGVGSNVGFFRAKTPYFIKVMIPKSLSRGKIEIPPKCSRKYGARFSKAVELSVPNHDAWMVRVKLSAGKVWLGEGWRNFHEHYLLETGSYLLFQLEGNSAFQVLIFDRSGTEIDYPPKNTPRVGPETSTRFIPSEVEDDSHNSLAETESDSDSLELEGTSRRRPLRSSGKRKPQCLREPLPPRSHKALKAAKEFNTNGVSFHKQMRKSYMRSGGVNISKKIMQSLNIDEGLHQVELRHDGEAWPVKMLLDKESRGKLCTGWLDFLKGNDVDAGDVCVFEQLETNVFDVHIFKCA